MKKYIFQTVSGFVMGCLLPLSLWAGDFDGSKPLICASVHATECDAEDQECISGPPWHVNFPVFMQIDFEAKTASTLPQHENKRMTKIELVDHLPGKRMSIQGNDDEYSWSMLISEETGSMTLAIAGEGIGFTVFGACTAN
jgi:hypothetical protein